MPESQVQAESSLDSTISALTLSDWDGLDFRHEVAFPKLTAAMVDRIMHYGRERTFPANATLYSYGDRNSDLFVVLEGSVNIYLTAPDGSEELLAEARKFCFTGEFNILSSQRAVVEVRTVAETRLLQVTRSELRRLMYAEGDIANLIVQAAIWRRIGILKTTSSGVILIGEIDDPDTLLLRRFLVRNAYPFRFIDAHNGKSSEWTELDLPAIGLLDGRTLHRPSISTLAEELGITELPDQETLYDVAVVGAGPSGLAAAVYAASEGLATIVLEGLAPGGQAGTSSRIENYLGFPTGISGLRLAGRAHLQALKFGVQFAISREVVSVCEIDGYHQLTLAGGIPVRAKSIIVATGAQYRKLNVENYRRYENCGLFYAATPMEALPCRGKEVIVIGGGNSAGQASTFLAGVAKHVYHIVRGPSLSKTMSRYLISRIENSSHISLCAQSEIVALSGEPTLQSVVWENRVTGEVVTKDISHVFVMIGAEPNTGWINGAVRLDQKGFILTGGMEGFERSPYATSSPGIYAVGDVRSNSVKRVASAVGEGSVVISDIHRYLASQAL